jgi:hypothetical protein
MEKMNTVQPLFPHLPECLAGLEELAENLWWSWNPGAPDYRAMPWPTVKERKSVACIHFMSRSTMNIPVGTLKPVKKSRSSRRSFRFSNAGKN